MTTASLPISTPASAHRIWRIVRLNTVNTVAVVWTPVAIMAFIWLINWLIWWIIWAATTPADRADAMDGTQWSGGAFYIFVYMLVAGIAAVSSTFPFALGYSVTRRDFALGSGVTFVLLAAGYALGFTALSLVEEWTDGWGLGGHLFTSVYFTGDTIASRFFIVFSGMLFFIVVGAFSATIFTRWRMNGLLIATAALVLLAVAAGALLTVTGSWPALGEWLFTAGPTGIAATLLLPTALAGLAGYTVIRRATPRT